MPVSVIRDDNWQTNPRFGTGDTVILVGGNGTWLTGTNPVVSVSSVRWVSGVAPWDLGNQSANVGLTFSEATASAFRTLGWSADQYVQQIANTISHEIGHTFGLDHVTRLDGTAELMGTAETGTQVRSDGSFSSAVLPRQHGGSYSSEAYLSALLGVSQAWMTAHPGSTLAGQRVITDSGSGIDATSEVSAEVVYESEELNRPVELHGDAGIEGAGEADGWVVSDPMLVTGSGPDRLTLHESPDTVETTAYQDFVFPEWAKRLVFTISGKSYDSLFGSNATPDAFGVATFGPRHARSPGSDGLTDRRLLHP